MRHAFLIIAHNEPAVLGCLLSLLDTEEADIYLHIDRRADTLYGQFAAWRPAHARFWPLADRRAVCWGDISQVDVELDLFSAAHAHGPYAYYHLLSGTDLPLRAPAEIFSFFARHQGREFVHFWQSEAHRRDLSRKVARHYLFTRHLKDKGTLTHALTAPVRNLCLALQKLTGYSRRADAPFCKGSNWVSVTEAFCTHLLEQAPALRRRLTRTLCPDEIFVQTVLWNSPFRERLFSTADDITKASLRHIDWQRGHPYVWQDADFDELMASGALFARKFSCADTTLLRRISEACGH